MNSISLITQITFSPHKNPEMSINISIYMVDTYGHLMAYVQSNSGQLNDSSHANLRAACAASAKAPRAARIGQRTLRIFFLLLLPVGTFQ